MSTPTIMVKEKKEKIRKYRSLSSAVLVLELSAEISYFPVKESFLSMSSFSDLFNTQQIGFTQFISVDVITDFGYQIKNGVQLVGQPRR